MFWEWMKILNYVLYVREYVIMLLVFWEIFILKIMGNNYKRWCCSLKFIGFFANIDIKSRQYDGICLVLKIKPKRLIIGLIIIRNLFWLYFLLIGRLTIIEIFIIYISFRTLNDYILGFYAIYRFFALTATLNAICYAFH